MGSSDVQCIAPQMIILRVVRGRAWTRNTSAMTDTNLEFTRSAQAATETQLGFGASTEDVEGKHAEFVATQRSNASTVDVV